MIWTYVNHGKHSLAENPMERRRLIKLIAGASVTAVSSPAENMRASRVPLRGKPLVPGPKTKVSLAGVSKNAPENTVKQAVRCSTEAATRFFLAIKGRHRVHQACRQLRQPLSRHYQSPRRCCSGRDPQGKRGRPSDRGDMSGVEYLRFSPTLLKGSTRELMESSGMAKVVQASGAELNFFEEAGWSGFHEEMPLAGSHWKHALMMPDVLKEVQHIVLMPRCGTHLLAGCTLGLKAAVGYWRHDTRLEYHHDASTFNEKTAEANTVETLRKKQRLVITAADKILTTIGPDKGSIFQPDNGLVIASESVVAHDMVSLAWLLENKRTMPDTEKNGFIDTSKLIPRLANHVLVGWLGGWGQALNSEAFNKKTLNAVWDDLVLNHAYEVLRRCTRNCS